MCATGADAAVQQQPEPHQRRVQPQQQLHFWQYMQPGYDALDFISCTGTNFLVRANAYQVSFRPAADFAVFLASVASTISAHGIDWGL